MTKPTLAIYGIKDRNEFKYPAYVHDHNICLWKDGKILQYMQLERHTLRKYDNRLDLFIEDIIDNHVIDLPEEFDVVCVNDFVGNAFVSKKGRLRFEFNYSDKLEFSLSKGRGYFQYDGWNGKPVEAYVCSHEVAHICSTLPFFGEFKDNSLLVSIDGGSSLGNYSAFLYKDGKYQLIENGWDDLGYASKLFNDNALSFRMLNAKPGEHCSVPGKLMGFASYGHYNPEIEEWLIKYGYFKEYWNQDNEILESIKDNFGVVASFSTRDTFMQNIAATMQRIFEKAIISKLKSLQERFNCDYLYYGGGCALNIVANTKIMESGMFREVSIAPCCNDSGLSIGAGAFMETLKGNKVNRHTPYLNNFGLMDKSPVEQPASTGDVIEAAKCIADGGVLGVCNGWAEVGPRALGNRSIIARPDNKHLAEIVSTYIKKREWYRPVAPIMLQHNAEKVAVQKPGAVARFMLQDFTIREEFIERLSGVTHVDGTARIQVVPDGDSDYMSQLLSLVESDYDMLALINTSFNIQGQPIVHTEAQALDAMYSMSLDGLVLNGKFIKNDKK